MNLYISVRFWVAKLVKKKKKTGLVKLPEFYFFYSSKIFKKRLDKEPIAYGV
jgi:hypothetical protein